MYSTNPNIPVIGASTIFLPSNEDFILFFDSENSFHLTGAKNVSNVLTFIDYETGGGGTGIPGGINTQVQFNNGGVFGGITGVTSDGITITVNSIIIKDQNAPFHRFKIVIDGTGMLVLPGEDLGV